MRGESGPSAAYQDSSGTWYTAKQDHHCKYVALLPTGYITCQKDDSFALEWFAAEQCSTTPVDSCQSNGGTKDETECQFDFSTTNTSNATTNTVNRTVTLKAGEVFRASTNNQCMDLASSTTDTLLRLYGPDGAEVASNDDSDCGSGGTQSYLRYNVPTNAATGSYTLKAGCYSSQSCSGTVTRTILPN